MVPSDASFGGTFPFVPHVTGAPGFRMHYVDEGPRDGAGVGVNQLSHFPTSWKEQMIN